MSIQPAEFAKIMVILIVAAYLGDVTKMFNNPNAAILKIRTKLSGSPNVVTKSDLVYSLFRKDGLNG